MKMVFGPLQQGNEGLRRSRVRIAVHDSNQLPARIESARIRKFDFSNMAWASIRM
jgi:hypothetical protein